MSKIILLIALIASCMPPHSLPIGDTNGNIILITLDGVRWQELFDGQAVTGEIVDSESSFPNLYKWFVHEGIVFGKKSEVRVSGPAHVSMPGYLEIMRGYPSFDCTNNDCDHNTKPTLVNQFQSSAVISSWNMINFVVDDSPVMNTGRTYRNAKWNELKLFDYKETPNFWGEDYRPDFYTKKAVREYLGSNCPQFLWISLGDTDETAHEGDYWGYLMSLKAADKFIGELIQEIESSFARDHTVVIVTTDHGRGLDWRNHGWDYESSRTWIMMHGSGIPHLGLVKLNKTVHPSNIYPTVMELKTGRSQEDSLLNKRLYK